MEPVSTLYFGPFILDVTDDSLWFNRERCRLTAKAMVVLRYLVTHPGRLVRKADLMAAVWPGLHVSDWALTTCIREIRQVLGDVAKTPQYIATVHRQGYRFIAPVTVVAASPPLSVPALPPPHATLTAGEALPSVPTATAPEAEHKRVTILSGALSEAPALAAELGSERWYRLSQTVLGLAREVLQHYGGSLTLATHDSFTAVFGAPLAQEDHARRAVLAALELRQRLQDAPALHTQLAGGVLSLGMGLDSGRVVVGQLGSDSQATAIGTPLHVATRLQQQAAPGTILLSVATYHLVHADVQAVPRGTLDLDGQSSSVPVYAVRGLRQRHTGVTGRGLRTLSPFVGRERELALLYDHLATAVGSQGQAVGVVGAPGMGKTRLLTEFCRRVSGEQVTVYEGRCLSYGQTTPYLPVRDIVRQICGLTEGDEPSVHTAAVQQRLHESGITAADDVALLLQLLDLPVAAKCLAPLSPEARQARTFALLRHLVLDAAQKQPLILVMENLHWSDPTSDAWLASLAERLPGAAVLLVGTYRPGYQPVWGAHAAVTQIALPPLRGPDSRTVVQSVLGAVSLPEARLQTMEAQAEGNPFFLEELAWDAVEQGDRDTLGTVPETVPETVHAVLAARMDRLPSEAKRLLQMAAVIGPEVPVPLLQALGEVPEAMHCSLAHLQAAEFLYETRLFPEPVYSFKHALTHEVAYGSLLQERRRTLHARIVEILETNAPDRLAEQVERLAHHAMKGEVWEKALFYLCRAGRKAAALPALPDARAWYEQALGVLAALPESPSTLEQGFEIRLALRGVVSTLGEVRLALEYLREAEALAERLHDDDRRGRASAFATLVHTLLGELDEALVAGTRALEIAGHLGDLGLRLLATTYLEQAHYYRGDYHRVVELGTDTLAALPADRASKSFVSLYCRYWLVMSLAQLGRFAEGAQHGAEALRLAEPTQHATTIGRAHFAAGRLYLLKGDWATAYAHFERGIVAYRTGHIFLSLHHAVAASAWVLAQVGEASEALARLREAEQLLERQAARGGGVDQHGGDYHALGRAALLIGRLDEAQRLGDHALAYASSHHGFAAHALHLLGDIATHPDRFDAECGAAHYQRAQALAEELGMRPLVAHCHHGLGRLYVQSGRAELARTALTTAIDLYRAMDMTFWLPQAEAALAQLGEATRPV